MEIRIYEPKWKGIESTKNPSVQYYNDLEQTLIKRLIKNEDKENKNQIASDYFNLGELYFKIFGNNIDGCYKMALDIYRKIESQKDIANTLNNIASVNYEIGNFIEALEAGNDALSLFESTNDIEGKIIALSNLGEINLRMGCLTNSKKYFNMALEHNHLANNKDIEIYCNYMIGNVYRANVETEKSIEIHENILNQARQDNNKKREFEILGELGHDWQNRLSDKSALIYYEKQLQLANLINDYFYITIARINVGKTLYYMGDYIKAFHYIANTRGIAHITVNLKLQAELDFLLSKCSYERATPDFIKDAINQCNESLSLWRKIQCYEKESEVLEWLTYYIEKSDGLEKAIEFLKNELDSIKDNNKRYSLIAKKLGQLLLKNNKFEMATNYFDEALDKIELIGDSYEKGNILINKIRSLKKNKHKNMLQVQKCLHEATKIFKKLGCEKGLEFLKVIK
jgi:tetratricopeptide (TPR) repeat protein